MLHCSKKKSCDACCHHKINLWHSNIHTKRFSGGRMINIEYKFFDEKQKHHFSHLRRHLPAPHTALLLGYKSIVRHFVELFSSLSMFRTLESLVQCETHGRVMRICYRSRKPLFIVLYTLKLWYTRSSLLNFRTLCTTGLHTRNGLSSIINGQRLHGKLIQRWMRNKNKRGLLGYLSNIHGKERR